MASDTQRENKIKKVAEAKGLLGKPENLFTKDALTNDDRRELHRQLLVSYLSRMADDDPDKADLTDFLAAIDKGDEIDFMPKPYTGPWGFAGKEYATEAEADAAYAAYAEDERNKKESAYKRKISEQPELIFYEIPSQG